MPDGTVITNDNWKSDQEAEIIASTVPPTDDKESAIVATLSPVDVSTPGSGAYTAVVRGKDNGTGIALVEVYDLDDPSATAQLANISTRGLVETEDNVMIGGFIIPPPDDGRVLVRAIGPSLASSNVVDALQDPTVELHDASGTVVASNDNWPDTDKAEIEATGIAPKDPLESAIVTTLPAGAYTSVVRGAGGATGVALVEVYHLE